MKHTLHHLIIAVLSVLGIVLLNVGFIFLLLGFLPTLVAYFVDETPRKDLYKTVRATNLAGMLPALAAMTKTSYPGASLQIAMSNPNTWMMVYGSAAIGWVLIWLCRWIAYLSGLAAGEARIILLERAQEDLAEEWGDELKEYVITSDGGPPPAA